MTATAAAQQSGDARRPIFAERFKTQTCKNFEQKGECPYEWRCMFAHGEHELRTKEMNIADDLVTEEAIKAFQKAREIAAKAARRKSRRDEARSRRRRREAAGGCEPAAPTSAPAIAAGGNAVGQAILAQLQRGAAASTAPPAPAPSACGPLGVPAMLEDDEQHEADPKAEAIVSPSSRQRRDPYASAYVPDEVSGGAASTSAVAGAAPVASSDDDHAPQQGASDDTSGSGDSPSAVNAGSPPAATVIGTTKYRATVPACPVPPTPASGAFQALTSAEYGMAESGSNFAVSPEASFEAVTCAASWQMMQWQAAFVAQFQQQLLAQQQQQNQYGGGSSNNQADLSAHLASAAAAASCMINPWLMNPQAAAAASAAAATGAPNLSPQPEPRAPQQQHQRRGRAGRVSH